jgi:hypothetical protein
MSFESVKALEGHRVTQTQPLMTIEPVRVLRDLSPCATICVRLTKPTPREMRCCFRRGVTNEGRSVVGFDHRERARSPIQ